LKYTLWDYLKALGNFDVRQIANLAKLYGYLFGHSDLPLHFLKVLNFDPNEEERQSKEGTGLSKPQQLFLYVLFDSIFQAHTPEQLKAIFKKGLKARVAKRAASGGARREEASDQSEEEDDNEEEAGKDEDKLVDFRRGLSEYLLTKFYLKKKKEGSMDSASASSDLKEKFKACFDVINKQ
jgi:hypothetical protein